MIVGDLSSHRFRALDGWRGVCALLVALFHFQANSHFAMLSIVRNAWLFVDFFFVLSGFVITYAYAQRLSSVAKIKTFTLRRFARLWPLHIAVLAALIVLELYRFVATGTGFAGERSPLAIITNVFLIQSLGIHDRLTWNTPSWSISTEFYTYLVFAGMCALSAGARMRAIMSIVLAACSIAILMFLSRYGMRETFCWGFFRCLYGFTIGSLTCEIWKRFGSQRTGGSVLELATVTLVIIYLVFIGDRHALEYLAPFLFAFLVWVFAGEGGVVSRLMSSRGINALGRWSYSIYMVHMFIIALLFSLLDTIGGWTVKLSDASEKIVMGNSFAADFLTLAYLAAVIALAALTWRFIERFGQRLFNPAPAHPRPTIAASDIPL